MAELRGTEHSLGSIFPGQNRGQLHEQESDTKVDPRAGVDTLSGSLRERQSISVAPFVWAMKTGNKNLLTLAQFHLKGFDPGPDI